jgi:hypothetical protein
MNMISYFQILLHIDLSILCEELGDLALSDGISFVPSPK